MLCYYSTILYYRMFQNATNKCGLCFEIEQKITKQRVERGSKNRYYMISSKRCSKIKHKNNNITKER